MIAVSSKPGSPVVSRRETLRALVFGRASRRSTTGFSLIEFVVIISIFAIMAGVGLFNFRGFQTDVSLTNLAHDIALTIKRAQSEGTSGISDPNSSQLTPIPRGVAFTYNQSGSVFDPEFVIFDEIGGNTSGFDQSSDSVVDTIRIQSEDYILGIATNADPSINGTFSILFQRPFPEVQGFYDNGLPLGSAEYAAIVVSNQDQSRKKMIKISRVGEISVIPCDIAITSLCGTP